MSRRATAVAAVALAVVAGAGAHAAVPRVFAVDAASPVGRVSVELRAQAAPHTVELGDFAAGADPFVYVLDPSGRSSWAARAP